MKLNFRVVWIRWLQRKGDSTPPPSILSSLAASQNSRACLTWPEAPPWAPQSIWRWECKPRRSVCLWGPGRLGAPFSLFCLTLSLFVPQKQEATAATNKPLRVRVRAQQTPHPPNPKPSHLPPPPQPNRISMRRIAAPSLMWDMPPGLGISICFTHSGYSPVSPGQGAAPGWCWGRGHSWGTANCHNGRPSWLHPCLSL